MADQKITALTAGTPLDTDVIPFVDLTTGTTKKATKTDLKGDKGDTGAKGDTGTAATIAVGTTTTSIPGGDASVTNSGSSSAAIFNFTIPRGEVGINWLGAWDSGTTYVIGDAVSVGGSSYYCILGNTNETPPNATYWGLIANKGSDGTGDMDASVYDPNGIASDVFDQDNMVDGTTNKNYTATEKTKLSGIEASADVTDATNVAAAGAVMESDTSTASMSFVIDEDNMASDSATKVPTQQSVKAYVDANAGGGITWNEITGTSQTASVDNGYIANNAGLVTVTIPTTAAVGSVVRVAGVGAGGWKIAQNASEIIHFGNLASTTGTGGYIASTNRYDAVELVCVVADTEWAVISSVGNITVN